MGRPAQFRKSTFLERSIGEASPLQPMLFGCDLQDSPKQYSFRGVSTDMRITDAIQLAIRRAHNTDTGDFEALR